MRPGLLLAAFVAACAFAGSASAAGNPFGVTVVRFLPGTTPAQMRAVVTAAGGVVVTDLSAIDALAVVPRSPSFNARIDANRSVTSFFQDTLLAADRGIDLHLRGSRRGGPGSEGHDDPVDDPWHGLFQWDDDRMDVSSAWRRTTGSRSIAVAVLDTGVDASHKELKGVVDRSLGGNFIPCSDLIALYGLGVIDRKGLRDCRDGDFEGHGTWVASRIAGALNGFASNGVAPGVRIGSYKVMAAGLGGLSSWILSGLVAACSDPRIDVVNMSIEGYMDPAEPFTADDYLLFTDAVSYCNANGVAVFGAAGNEHVRVDRVSIDLGGRQLDGVGRVSLGSEGIATVSPGSDSLADYDLRNWLVVRTVALVADPDCSAQRCRVWAGTSGGGVWRTNNILAADPVWNQVAPTDLAQNSVGELVLDPSDRKHDTLYLGTGEPNRCSSGCEAGVGLYRSKDGGEHWTKLAGTCVSNARYACVNPGQDAFLGRAIAGIVIDPRDRTHLLVGSAQAVRGLSHTIGNGGTTRLEPGANEPGLYESFDGGKTFTEVWDGAKPDPGPQSFGINKLALDPRNPDVVYVSAFDAGLWRRDAGSAPTAFVQLFKPQFVPPQCTPTPTTLNCALLGVDRTMFALTAKNGHTRIYLTEGTQPNVNSVTDPLDSNFWRTDLGDQPAAALLASQGACTAPDPATHTFPATYPGWQCLTSQQTPNPYFASDDFCTQQCWYDQDVYTPEGMPDTVYLIGSFLYGELPCNTKGVGCGNGRSNGRGVLYSTTAGDPDGSRTDLRTFTDLTNDARDTPAPWCALAPYLAQGCVRAPNGLHPDQHAIVVNPANPTQLFESNDGGVFRTSGAFADISSQCDDPNRSFGDPLPPASGSYASCKRLLSRVSTALAHVDNRLSSTLQFINVTINPALSCEVMGGTQDNGTWSNTNGCNRDVFNQIVYGDGGNAVYDATEPTWRANEFTGGFGDSNFRNGDPERWVITTAPMTNSGETFAFYWPQIGDPNPVPGTHPIYNGGNHVWRTWAFGAGTPGAVPQDTTPNIADYEANCPEFVTPGAGPGSEPCGDYRPLGGPVVYNGDGSVNHNVRGDLTGTFYGADRTGGSMSFMARSGADHGTMWAATSAGRVFVSHNVDASDPDAVSWHRIDNASSPTRFPSGIYIDPADAGHAWVTYSGYNAATPTTPGHVFEVSENGSATGSGIFTNLNVESGTNAYPTPFDDGDLPVSDVVRDDATHTLYVATDFGVLRGSNDGHAGWHTTVGMPRYEVMHLEIQPSNRVPTCMGGGHCERVLYAATHSQGIWRMKLGGRGHR